MTFKAEPQFASEQGKWRAREDKRADLHEVYRRHQIRTVSFEQFWSDLQSGRLFGKEAT